MIEVEVVGLGGLGKAATQVFLQLAEVLSVLMTILLSLVLLLESLFTTILHFNVLRKHVLIVHRVIPLHLLLEIHNFCLRPECFMAGRCQITQFLVRRLISVG